MTPHHFLSENDVCPDVCNHAATIGEIIHMDFIKDQIQKEVYGFQLAIGWKECQKLTSDVVSVIMKTQVPRQVTMSLWNQILTLIQHDQQMQSTIVCRCALNSKPLCLVYDDALSGPWNSCSDLLNGLEMLRRRIV